MPNDAVFMIGWEFPPHHSGGLGVACAGLTRSLLEMGQPLVFTLPKAMRGGGAYRTERFYHTDDLSLDMILVNSNLQPYWRQVEDGAANFVVPTEFVHEVEHYADMVAEVSTQHSHDVIHAHDWMSIPAGIAARQQTRKPLVVHIHSTEFDRSGGGTPNEAIAEIEYQGLNEADQIVTVSEYSKRLLMQQYGVPERNIEVVHNGVDPLPEYHDQPLNTFLYDRPVIVFVGRLTIQKGPEYFLSVAKQVLAQEPRAVFVLAGHGDMYQSLLVSSAFQQLSGSVLFAGFLRDKEKVRMLQRASVFVMPSVSEPFGISALEAALAKTPVIISKNSGAAEVLPNAYAIDFWDVNKMSSTILNLLKNEPLRQAKGAQVKAEAQAHTWDTAAQKMNTIYQKLRT